MDQTSSQENQRTMGNAKTALVPSWMRPRPDQLDVQTAALATMPDSLGPYLLDTTFKPMDGGMGCVYRALNVPLIGGYVAIKVVKVSELSAEAIELFEREAGHASRARHQYVVQVFTAGRFKLGNATLPYYVMEWLDDPVAITDGRLLSRLSLGERVALFFKVCEAVEHAHEQSVVHGDLKPTNIAVVNWKHRPDPKILDFGLSRSIAGLRPQKMPVAGGTRGYMPPESQRPDWKGPTVTGDVYALGVILREMLYLPPAGLPEVVDARLDGIIRRATAGLNAPTPRYASVTELMDDLKGWQSSGVRQSQLKWTQWSVRTPARAFALLVLIAVVLGAVLGGLQRWKVPLASIVSGYAINRSTPAIRSLPNVRVVRITDENRAEAFRLAGISEEESRDTNANRRLIARMLDRLSPHRPSVVFIDSFFYGEKSVDSILADSIRGVLDSGSGVVLALDTFGVPKLEPSRAIYGIQGVQTGVAAVTTSSHGMLAPVLVDRAPDPPKAGVALLAAALHLEPGKRPIFRFAPWDRMTIEGYGRSKETHLHAAPEPSLLIPALPAQDRLKDEIIGIDPGDWVGPLIINFRDSNDYARYTIGADELFSASTTALAESVRGKIVVLAYNSSTVDSLAAIGRPNAHGCYAQAAAIQQLVSGRTIIGASSGASLLLTVIVACLGTCSGWLFARARGRIRDKPAMRRAVWASLLGVGGVFASVLIVGLCAGIMIAASIFFEPTTPVLAGSLGLIIGALLLSSGRRGVSYTVQPVGVQHADIAPVDDIDFNDRRRALQ